MKKILIGQAMWTACSSAIAGMLIWGGSCLSEGVAPPPARVRSSGPSQQTAIASTVADPKLLTASISIENFTFNRREISVAPGTTVTWTNQDDVPHTITATNADFASGTLDTDDRFSHRFLDPGTYTYYCGVHPHMTAKVVVLEKSASR